MKESLKPIFITCLGLLFALGQHPRQVVYTYIYSYVVVIYPQHISKILFTFIYTIYIGIVTNQTLKMKHVSLHNMKRVYFDFHTVFIRFGSLMKTMWKLKMCFMFMVATRKYTFSKLYDWYTYIIIAQQKLCWASKIKWEIILYYRHSFRLQK